MYLNRFVIHSQCSRREIVEKLKALTHPGDAPFFDLNFTDKDFYGKVEDDRFEITRVRKSRNGFLPFMNGKIMEGTTTTIEVKMRPVVPVLLAFLFMNIVALYQTIEESAVFILVPLFINLGWGYIYFRECRIVKALFEKNFAKGCR